MGWIAGRRKLQTAPNHLPAEKKMALPPEKSGERHLVQDKSGKSAAGCLPVLESISPQRRSGFENRAFLIGRGLE